MNPPHAPSMENALGSVSVREIHKSYDIPRHQVDRLVQFATLGRVNLCRKHVALDGVSFDLPSGGSLAIIGENGAGKSTLLKIITGVTAPTAGSVQVKGRVSALLELGTGFHPDLTGAENASNYLRLFADAREPDRELLDRVRAFAELGAFYDRPMRTYSTGMRVRLAFAAACFTNPDILIIDEALSVGDAYFQQKCLDKIEQFKKRGITLLFVSHNLSVAQMFCERAIYLEAGRIAAEGTSREVVAEYERRTAQRRGVVAADGKSTRAGRVQAPKASSAAPTPDNANRLDATSPEVTVGSRYGNGKIRITGVRFEDQTGRERGRFRPEDELVVTLDYESDGDHPDALFSVAIFRLDGVYLFATNNFDVDPCPTPVRAGSGRVRVRIGPLSLHKGTFLTTVMAFTEPQQPFWNDPADYHHKCYEFHVLSDEFPHGCVRLPARWSAEG